MTKWGLTATIKAAHTDVLDFAAFHLDQGAHRLFIYLDDTVPQTFAALKAHPKIRVTTCDAAHWDKLGKKRPAKQEVRQTLNATHAYNRNTQVDWLAHIDGDEFLWPETNIAAVLAALPADRLCARARPNEALSGDGTAFKAFIPNGPDRTRLVAQLYPNYAPYIKGGFLSHVAGKLFVRTGLADISFRIHNVFQGDTMNPCETELSAIALFHCHARNWDDWIAAYRHRLTKGAYRADLAPAQGKSGMTLHELFKSLELAGGEAALRKFFDEVSADSPELRAKLAALGLLRLVDLDLKASRARHFPDELP